jgi:hypothetical protein
MDRRNKDRHNLQLVCLAQAGTAHSAPLEGMTENMSRDGILLRWLDSVPLPEIGAALSVEVELPSSEFGPRVMKCSTTVVRITRRSNGVRSVGLRIEKVRFRSASSKKGGKPVSLAEMKPVTTRVI